MSFIANFSIVQSGLRQASASEIAFSDPGFHVSHRGEIAPLQLCAVEPIIFQPRGSSVIDDALFANSGRFLFDSSLVHLRLDALSFEPFEGEESPFVCNQSIDPGDHEWDVAIDGTDRLPMLEMLEAEALIKLRTDIPDPERQKIALTRTVMLETSLQNVRQALSEEQMQIFIALEHEFWQDLQQLDGAPEDLITRRADQFAVDLGSLDPALAEGINEQYAYMRTKEGFSAWEFMNTMEAISRQRLELRICGVREQFVSEETAELGLFSQENVA